MSAIQPMAALILALFLAPILASGMLSCAAPAPPPARIAAAPADSLRMPIETSGTVNVLRSPDRKFLAGVGARPLTDRLSVTYFIRSVDPAGDTVMDLVVFMKGDAGWTRRKTDWSFDTQPPVAFSQFVFPEAQFRVELDQATGGARVLDYTGPTSKENVIVVDGFGGPTFKVTYVEHQDLRAAFRSDPIRDFLLRSPKLQEAVGLAAATEGGSTP